MSDPYVGEIRLFPYTFAPYGWADCNGALLPIQQYQALYAVIGNTFGGTYGQNFNIPDLRNRVVLGAGQGINLSPRAYTAPGGEASHTLTMNEMPLHNHNIISGSASCSELTPVNNYWGVTKYTPPGSPEKAASSYSTASSIGDTLNNNFIGIVGKNQGHENRQPALTLRFCIALDGVFPVRP